MILGQVLTSHHWELSFGVLTLVPKLSFGVLTALQDSMCL